MYPARIFRNCYREAARFEHRKGLFTYIRVFVRKHLSQETPVRFRSILSLLIVIGCMPMALLIALVTAVWRYVKLRLLLFELRKRDIVTHGERNDDSESPYEAVFVADGWVDRKLIYARINQKASPLLYSVKISRGSTEVWCRSPSIKSFDEFIVQKSSVWKHRRASLANAHECASSFLQEPLASHEPPWRITLQHLHEASHYTLITIKCDIFLKQELCEALFDRYSVQPTVSPFRNTLCFSETISDEAKSVVEGVKSFALEQCALLLQLQVVLVVANVCRSVVRLCAMLCNACAVIVKWMLGSKPSFLNCDNWKEFVMAQEEVTSAVDIVTDLPLEILPNLIPIKPAFVREPMPDSTPQVRRSISCAQEDSPRSHIPKSSFTESANANTQFMWSQPLPEDVLWRVCQVSGHKRTALLTAICMSELRRATFDYAPAQRKVVLNYTNGDAKDDFEIHSDFRSLSDPSVVESELSKQQLSKKGLKMRGKILESMRANLPRLFAKREKREYSSAISFHSNFEKVEVFQRKLILHLERREVVSSVVFSVHRGQNNTIITCQGIPPFQLRLLVIGIERRIYALASQYGVQTMRLSPFSSPHTSEPSSPLKSFFSSSTSSIEEFIE